MPDAGLYKPKFEVAKKIFPLESAVAGGATMLLRKGNESPVPRMIDVPVSEGAVGKTPEKLLL